jgi:hypothetical protein
MGCLLCGARLSAAEQEAEDVAGLNCMEKERTGHSEAGTATKVYLRGDEVQSVDCTTERGSVVVRREYYFHRRSLVSVIETIHNKWDRHLGPLKHPRLVSTAKFNVEDEACDRRSEFLQQAKQLLADFRERRTAYRPCASGG